MQKFFGCGLAVSVCGLGSVSVSGCVLASVFAVLACACMLFGVSFHVVKRVVCMLLVSGGRCGKSVCLMVINRAIVSLSRLVCCGACGCV